jgi:hypothetical protein
MFAAQTLGIPGNGRLSDHKSETARLLCLSTRTEAGTGTDLSDEQKVDGVPSMSGSFESRSNVTVRRLLQQMKQPSRRTLTEDGMRIDSNESQYAKACRSIDRRFESSSNATCLSRVFTEQQHCRSSAIKDGS